MAVDVPPLEVLFEDNHCLAVVKPPGWVSAHYQGEEETLDRAIKAYLKEKYHKPGNVFLGVVHRLDKPVSGVLLFARTSKAAARLSEQFREGSIEKVYWAVVEGEVQRSAGTLEDWLYRNREKGRVECVEPRSEGARQALLHYQKRASHGGLTFLEVRPQTGRTHQLRVQLAHHGHPIFGDAKYGAIHTFSSSERSSSVSSLRSPRSTLGIGLHARSLTFLHPVRYEPVTLTADVPRHWRGRFAYLLNPGASA
jgi:23S rRNA pseudouridine1911/1915/1917 synthase